MLPLALFRHHKDLFTCTAWYAMAYMWGVFDYCIWVLDAVMVLNIKNANFVPCTCLLSWISTARTYPSAASLVHGAPDTAGRISTPSIAPEPISAAPYGLKIRVLVSKKKSRVLQIASHRSFSPGACWECRMGSSLRYKIDSQWFTNTWIPEFCNLCCRVKSTWNKNWPGLRREKVRSLDIRRRLGLFLEKARQSLFWLLNTYGCNDKILLADLLWEKNTVEWPTDSADKLKWT